MSDAEWPTESHLLRCTVTATAHLSSVSWPRTRVPLDSHLKNDSYALLAADVRGRPIPERRADRLPERAREA